MKQNNNRGASTKGPPLTTKQLQILNNKQASPSHYPSSEVGDSNDIDTPMMLEGANQIHTQLYHQSSSEPNLNNDPPKKGKKEDSSYHFGEQSLEEEGSAAKTKNLSATLAQIARSQRKKQWRAYQKLIQYYNQQAGDINSASSAALAISTSIQNETAEQAGPPKILNKASINQTSDEQLPQILQIDNDSIIVDDESDSKFLNKNKQNTKPQMSVVASIQGQQAKVPSVKLDRTLKVYLGLKEKREVRNLKANLESQSILEQPSINVTTQDIIELASRPPTKLTVESSWKQKKKERIGAAHSNRIKIIDGELPVISSKFNQVTNRTKRNDLLETELAHQTQQRNNTTADRENPTDTATNHKIQTPSQGITAPTVRKLGTNMKPSLINHEDGSVIQNENGSQMRNGQKQPHKAKNKESITQIIKVEMVLSNIKNRSRANQPQNSNTVSQQRRVQFTQINQFTQEDITQKDVHNRTTNNAQIYKDDYNQTPQNNQQLPVMHRIRNQTQRNSIEYADAPDFIIPIKEFETQSLKRARRSFEQVDEFNQTPSLSRSIVQGGAIGQSSTERQSIAKPIQELLIMPPIQEASSNKKDKSQSTKAFTALDGQQHFIEGKRKTVLKPFLSPTADKRERYKKVMNFNEEVMLCEFEKAERMLKRAERLIKKAKLQAFAASIPGGRQAAIALGIIEDEDAPKIKRGQGGAFQFKKQEVKFSLPQI